MRAKLLIILNLLSFIGTLAVNTLANTLPINGRNTGELSALYPNEFVPAGYTFSIWLVIYLTLAGFVIYQAGAFFHDGKARMVEKMGSLFLLTNLFNMSWILAWHYLIVWLSVVIMIGLLVTLILIQFRFNIPDRTATMAEKIFLQIPFSIYLGWIMIATIANITALLVHLGWNGYPMPGQSWAIIMISVATLLCMVFLWKRSNPVIPLVAIWSVTGIISRQRNMNGWNDVVVAGLVCSSLLVLALVLHATRKTRQAK